MALAAGLLHGCDAAVALLKRGVVTFATCPEGHDQPRQESLPVIARRDTLAYRGAKFVKRNMAGVLQAASFAAVLVVNGFGARVAKR